MNATSDIIDRAVVETLETRQMLTAVAFDSGQLLITGLADSRNAVQVKVSNGRVMTIANGETSSRQLAGLRSITIIGGDKDDYIEVDRKLKVPVSIYAQAGNDRVIAGGGHDYVEGGAGNDTIYGGDGNDRVYGNGGDDRIHGGNGRDIINGGDGADVMFGEKHDDTFELVDATDRVYGGSGRDAMTLAGQTNTTTNTRGTTTTRPASQSTPIVTGFSLIDVSTGKKVAGYHNIDTGNVLDLSKLPAKLAIQANLSGAASVRFDFDGKKMYRVEHAEPFALAGDNGPGKFRTLNLSVGTHTLVGHAVTSDGMRVLSSNGITFSVIKSNTDTTTKPSRPASTDGSSNPGTDTNTDTTPTPPPVVTNPTSPPSDSGNGSNNDSSVPIIDADANAASPTAKIYAISTTVTAGTSVHVDAIGSRLGVGDWNESQLSWDFGDSGSRYNKLKGFNAAHTYDKPGSYSITLTVTNKAGKVDKARITVNVTSAQRKVIYVSNSGSDSNSGLSTSSPIKSFAKAVSMLGDNTEILFKRGETFTLKNSMHFKGSNIVVGAYGIGDRPTIKWNGARDTSAIFSYASNARSVTVQDLSIDTIFNKDTNDKGTPLGFTPDGQNITVRRCELLNLQFGANLNSKPNGFLFQDNIAPLETGLRKYMVWAEGDRITIIGNKAANSTREHIVRANGVSKILVMDNELTNINRRDSGKDQYDIRKTALNIQSGEFAYLADNRLDGGFQIGPLGKADGLKSPELRFYYAILEGNELINDSLEVNHGGEHITIRNNVLRSDGLTAINVDGFSSTFNRGVIDLQIYNNTAYNNDADYGSMVTIRGDVDGIRLLNNLYIAPKLNVSTLNSGGIRVLDTNLNSFTQINGNVWSIGGTAGAWIGENAKNFIGAGTDASGFQTASEWNNQRIVGTDHFNVLNLNGATFTTIGNQIVGAKRAA